MTNALVVGGANGIGLSIATQLAYRSNVQMVYIVDKAPVNNEHQNPKFETFLFDLTAKDYSIFDRFTDIDTLIITAGFGRLALFGDIDESMIDLSFQVNTVSAIRIIKHFYTKLHSETPFYCGVMVSVAGFMSSPFFSNYGATKAALKIFIESINVELLKDGCRNQVLNVSPGCIKGTSFDNGKTDLCVTADLANEIIRHMEQHDDLFIPCYEEIYKEVLRRYHADFRAEGARSYDYKLNSGRIK